jgi:hypothetical protein
MCLQSTLISLKTNYRKARYHTISNVRTSPSELSPFAQTFYDIQQTCKHKHNRVVLNTFIARIISILRLQVITLQLSKWHHTWALFLRSWSSVSWPRCSFENASSYSQEFCYLEYVRSVSHWVHALKTHYFFKAILPSTLRSNNVKFLSTSDI